MEPDTQEGGLSIAEYPGPTFRDVEVGSTGFVMTTGNTGESARRKIVSGVTFT